ncbi:hypothetical protein BCR33DRAFT_762746 [Rhizoclosmatium globosum]|uniref:Uncharacterized protein n=1 Tax=Rhizoclosmatium globosum TaxID=329046 RepID=A0A1Y2CTN7_9FUNG|nr:hypothetical protein BCR33DRAFT_762746 [Rhizoclosmatium globosum]|eukprot:ORY50420.1 hypothetical protein BCR33DRAFT_762746 [Rhizoclosmatium globosum]
MISSTLLAFAAAAVQVSAHGIMVWPIARALPGDQQQGYTYGKGAINVNLAPHPAYDINCNYLPPGPVFTQTLAPGPAVVDWTITAFHNGGCNVTISTDNQKTWQLLGQDPKCGIAPQAGTKGSGHIPITIPAVPAGKTQYNAILRWTYTANNGGQPANEAFASCADVVISTTGSNTHTFMDILPSTPSATDGMLPKSPWQFWDTSCKAGNLMCTTNPNFIQQCISLAASGGWNGGSSWYEYQCPNGTTCKAGTQPQVNDVCA